MITNAAASAMCIEDFRRLFIGYTPGGRAEYMEPESVDSNVPVELMPAYANPGLIDYHTKHKLRFTSAGDHECRECDVKWGRDEGEYCWYCGELRHIYSFEKHRLKEVQDG